MARRGRPSRSGKREKNGRHQRTGYPVPVYDKGSEWVQTMQSRYGTHYSTALGRAYAAGLLGDGAEALNRYQAAKKFASVYTRFIGTDAYRCPLDDTPRGNVVDLHPDHDANADQLRWLMVAMDSMDVAGVRPYFDALISSLHTDSGPFWLDSLLAGGKHPADQMLLKAALQALDIIAPEEKRMGIRAASW